MSKKILNFNDYKGRRLPSNIQLNVVNDMMRIWEKYKDCADEDVIIIQLLRQLRDLTIFLPDPDREKLFKKTREYFSDPYFYT